MTRIVRSHRGISPVIATILMITISIAAAATVSVVLSNFQNNTSSSTSDNYNLGTGGSTSSGISVDSQIIKLSTDSQLKLNGLNDYTKLSINVTYTGSAAYIYIIDFDVIVFGDKLDDFSLWSITGATGAFYTSKDGNYAGYKQANGTSAVYTVEVADINNARARVPYQTSFTYEIKIGQTPGEISQVIQKTHEARTIFNAVYYNVAILHHGTIATVDSAAYQFDQTLRFSTLNGTNRLFYLYDPAKDAYDYTAGPLNATYLALTYDIVIVDKWAVPVQLSSVLEYLHKNGTRLIFYGDLIEFGTTKATVAPMINATATEDITGVIPAMYDPNTNPTGRGWKTTDNGYSFTNDQVGLLFGLQSASFSEINSWAGFGTGDTYGLDAATLTGNSSMQVSVFGTAYYNFDSSRDGTYWSHVGPMLVENEQVTNEYGRVITYVWKTRINMGGATVADSSHLDRLRRNMISSIIAEDDRLANTQPAQISIDSLDFSFTSNTRFNVYVFATVTEGTVKNGTLNFEIDMPDMLNFSMWNLFQTVDIQIQTDPAATPISLTQSLDLGNGNVVNIDIGAVYAPSLPTGTQIMLMLPGGNWNRHLIIDQQWLEPENWRVTATFDIVGYTSNIYSVALDSSIDTIAPPQVAGVSANVVSDTQIDLSWTASSVPDLQDYLIYVDGSLVGTSITNSYQVTGLTASTNYTISVSARDTSQNEGLPSSPIYAKTLDTPPAQPELHVLSTSVALSGLTRNGRFIFTVTVYVVDGNGSPVAGVSVSVSLDKPQGQPNSGSGITGADGSVAIVITTNTNRSGTYTANVVNLTLTGYIFVTGPNDSASVTL